MGRRGPQPTPTKILKMRGSWRGDRRGDELKAPKERPRRPRSLRREAARVWNQLLPQLEQMKIVSTVDKQALGRYCQAVAKYWEAEKVLELNGSTYHTYDKQGSTIVNDRPEVARSAKLSEECRKLENLFGLNPAARASFAPVKASDEDENRGKSRFFNQGIA